MPVADFAPYGSNMHPIQIMAVTKNKDVYTVDLFAFCRIDDVCISCCGKGIAELLLSSIIVGVKIVKNLFFLRSSSLLV